MRQCTRFAWLLLVTGASAGAVALACPSAALAACTQQFSGEPNGLRFDLADRFKFLWSSAELSVQTVNPVGSEDPQMQGGGSRLTVSVKLSILNTEGLLALDVDNPVVFAVLNAHGGHMAWQGNPLDDLRQYHRVGIETVHVDGSLVDKFMPVGTVIELQLDPNHAPPSSIASIKGYLHGLYVDDVIEVDVPYDPNGGWVEPHADADLLILVDPANPPAPGPLQYIPIPAALATPYVRSRPKQIALYSYMTSVKSKTAHLIMALGTVSYSPSIYGAVSHVIVETQLFDSQHNKCTRFPTQQRAVSEFALGVGAHCLGWPSQDDNSYDTIRHVVGVHPVEVKIPFVLTGIPVPSIRAPTGE